MLENKKAPRGRLWLPSRPSGLLLGLALDFAFDRLAGHLRRRIGGFLAALAHAVLEAAHRAAQIGADVAQLLRAEDQHHDHQDDQPMPDAERTHMRLLALRRALLPARVLFLPLEHRTEGLRAPEYMHVDMIHLLMPHPAGVDDGAKAVARARLPRQAPAHREHPAERLLVARIGVVQRRQMHFRHDQEVDRRLRPDVVEGHHLRVVVDLLRRYLAARDLAKNAIGVGHFFRAAFSSRPEMPSRRCISASTSPGPRPWRASRIMQWNHRSAVSRTRCRRSPLFAASTVSVASSPIFFRMASSPPANSLATYDSAGSPSLRSLMVAAMRSSV